MLCKRYFVSGQVQGVSYRWAAAEQARRLGITGFARNLPDGRVEVLAAGIRESLQQFERWLWQGPSAARVDGLQSFDADPKDAPGEFRVLGR